MAESADEDRRPPMLVPAETAACRAPLRAGHRPEQRCIVAVIHGHHRRFADAKSFDQLHPRAIRVRDDEPRRAHGGRLGAPRPRFLEASPHPNGGWSGVYVGLPRGVDRMHPRQRGVATVAAVADQHAAVAEPSPRAGEYRRTQRVHAERSRNAMPRDERIRVKRRRDPVRHNRQALAERAGDVSGELVVRLVHATPRREVAGDDDAVGARHRALCRSAAP